MGIGYNYRYYLTENEYKQYRIQLKGFIEKYAATKLADVGEVVHFAQTQQRQGRYVLLYLNYKAAKYFNHAMCTYSLAKDNIYAAAYSFEKAESIDSTYEHQISYVSRYHFSFVEPSEVMMTNIKRAQQVIVEDETYQVNYTVRLTDNIYYPINTLYGRLAQFSNGNYTALSQTDEIQVASVSPELFFQEGQFNSVGNVIISRPMKGTMPRGRMETEDQQHYKTLQTSSKDRTENVMTVDLLRNGIGRISQSGSIKVYKLFFTGAYKTVFQMTSMVSGTLKNSTDLTQVLTSLFPCDLITGAPKLNAMKYIKQLENSPHGIYCGLVGLLLPTEDDKMIFSIPIRIAEYKYGQVIYGVGAGTTIDSKPKDEVDEFYAETRVLEML